MFLTLLLVTFTIAVLVSFGVAALFRKSLRTILNRILSPELGSAWYRYITFAIYVVGVSGGVRVWEGGCYARMALAMRRVNTV